MEALRKRKGFNAYLASCSLSDGCRGSDDSNYKEFKLQLDELDDAFNKDDEKLCQKTTPSHELRSHLKS